MFGLTIDDAPSANKDVGTSRIKRDKDDIQAGLPIGTIICVQYTLSRLDLSCDSGHCT